MKYSYTKGWIMNKCFKCSCKTLSNYPQNRQNAGIPPYLRIGDQAK